MYSTPCFDDGEVRFDYGTGHGFQNDLVRERESIYVFQMYNLGKKKKVLSSGFCVLIINTWSKNQGPKLDIRIVDLEEFEL